MENFKMADFYDNFRNSIDNLTDIAKRANTYDGSSMRYRTNDLINSFQYADEGQENEFRDDVKNLPRRKIQYTPFSWVGKNGEQLSGLVITNLTDGQIQGIELSDGRSLTPSGAHKFFRDHKNQGAFAFADEDGLVNTREKTTWPFQPGNPFYQYDAYGNAPSIRKREENDSMAKYPFEDTASNTENRLGSALNFFKNLRKAKGQE